MSAPDPLVGRRVLVTRPAERARGLIGAIEAAGGVPIALPTIEIVPETPSAEAVAAAHAADILLFTSPAAVAHGVEALVRATGSTAHLGGVGPATLHALRERGLEPAIEPVGEADSEGLLRSPILAPDRVRARPIVIVRGGQGRDALPTGLIARGASVHYADVYRRERPRSPAGGDALACDILTATSNEGLANLLAMFPSRGQSALLGQPLAVASERAAALARSRGFTHEPEIADAPGDAGMLAAIRRCAERLSRA